MATKERVRTRFPVAAGARRPCDGKVEVPRADILCRHCGGWACEMLHRPARSCEWHPWWRRRMQFCCRVKARDLKGVGCPDPARTRWPMTVQLRLAVGR